MCTLYTVHCIVYTVQCTVEILQCGLEINRTVDTDELFRLIVASKVWSSVVKQIFNKTIL